MQYFRCKCGSSTAWGSMGTQPCTGCPKCNTTLEQSPSMHETPIPHDPVVERTMRTHQGILMVDKTRTFCARCTVTLSEES